MSSSTKKSQKLIDQAPQSAIVLQKHLEIKDMDAYHQGSLSADAADRVREHLVLCHECRDQFLELVRFLEDDGSEGRVWSGEIAAVWQDWWTALQKREADSPLKAAVE